jgi:hypothetical protein
MQLREKNKPNPGSPEAVKIGCKCAVFDNHYGKGFPYGGETCFYINDNCPVHGDNNE